MTDRRRVAYVLTAVAVIAFIFFAPVYAPPDPCPHSDLWEQPWVSVSYALFGVGAWYYPGHHAYFLASHLAC